MKTILNAIWRVYLHLFGGSRFKNSKVIPRFSGFDGSVNFTKSFIGEEKNFSE